MGVMASKTNHHSKVQLTQQGFEELQREYESLLHTKRPAVVDRLSNARAMGDLSENSDYHQAKESLEFLDGRLAELESVLIHAHVVPTASKFDAISVGSTVKVKVGGSECVFNIVGEWEADPKERKISNESPLGKALVGKQPGEKVEVNAPAGKVIYEVIGIE